MVIAERRRVTRGQFDVVLQRVGCAIGVEAACERAVLEVIGMVTATTRGEGEIPGRERGHAQPCAEHILNRFTFILESAVEVAVALGAQPAQIEFARAG
jgi:hypothetical protein